MDWLAHITLAVLIGLFIVTYVAQITIVSGESMEPTLQHGNQLIVEKLTQRFGKLKHGDIVTLSVPEFVPKDHNPIIKRIIGVEGDKVEIKDGKVFVNGVALKEDYTNCSFTPRGPVPGNSSLTVPKGCVYVLGDNRTNSTDSRIFGPVNTGRIKGKALLRYFPLNRIGLIK